MGAQTEGNAMHTTHSNPPAVLHGYPVDHRLRNASRAQRGQRRGFSPLRTLAARLRRGTPAAQR
jgi:hypothetical protein